MMMNACRIFALLFMLVPVDRASAWGQEGHSIVAEIAQRRLEPEPLHKIEELFGRSVSLASISSWADDVRDERPETYNWHFVNVPLMADSYDPERDCVDTANGDCVVKKIERTKVELTDIRSDPAKRIEALKFLVHFIGDIHQPLHCVGDKQGGNDIHVTFFREYTNLHSVWDSGLIRHRISGWGAYVDLLEKTWLPGKDVESLAGGSPAEWALETHRAAVVVWASDGAILDNNYYNNTVPVLDKQLALAGLRLAHTLNELLKYSTEYTRGANLPQPSRPPTQ